MVGRELHGIISSSDIVRVVAERKLTARTYVFDRADVRDVRGWAGQP
jgi:hypothetical protein